MKVDCISTLLDSLRNYLKTNNILSKTRGKNENA